METPNLEAILAELVLAEDSIDLHEPKIPANMPSRQHTIDLLGEAINLLFPYMIAEGYDIQISPHKRIEKLFYMLTDCLSVLKSEEKEKTVLDILSSLPRVKRALISDAIAIYEGDPAATSPLEVMTCYPGFYAVAVQRIAHVFYLKGIPYLPRIMTEHAHSKTGIDIHPGAGIGDSFCIDHGTGVVIGETAEIGNNVKIYQGVTIGARIFERDGEGRLIKGKKRHPTIGNDCIIYAGATILGGDTVIGDGCIIGGNVWLTHSLPTGSRVYYDKK